MFQRKADGGNPRTRHCVLSQMWSFGTRWQADAGSERRVLWPSRVTIRFVVGVVVVLVCFIVGLASLAIRLELAGPRCKPDELYSQKAFWEHGLGVAGGGIIMFGNVKLWGLWGSLWGLGPWRAGDVARLVRVPPVGPLLGRSWGLIGLPGEPPGGLGALFGAC